MWNRNRDENNFLLQTITNTIPMNDYNPGCKLLLIRYQWMITIRDYLWYQVAAEVPGRLPQQYRHARCFFGAVDLGVFGVFWVYLLTSCAPATSLLCVSNDSRDSSCKTAPSPSLWHSLTHAHRSIGYRNIHQALSESVANLMYLRVYASRDSSCKIAPSPSLCCSLTSSHSTYRVKGSYLLKI
jgi:hypothetical protein